MKEARRNVCPSVQGTDTALDIAEIVKCLQDDRLEKLPPAKTAVVTWTKAGQTTVQKITLEMPDSQGAI